MYKLYPVKSFYYNRNDNLVLFLYKKNIWFILENLIFFVIEPLSSEPHYSKYWQSCFNAVFSHRRWTCVGSTFLFNQISALKQRWWTLMIQVASMLVQRWCVCWVICSIETDMQTFTYTFALNKGKNWRKFIGVSQQCH